MNFKFLLKMLKIIASFIIDFPKYLKIKNKIKYFDEIFYDKNYWKIEFYCWEIFWILNWSHSFGYEMWTFKIEYKIFKFLWNIFGSCHFEVWTKSSLKLSLFLTSLKKVPRTWFEPATYVCLVPTTTVLLSTTWAIEGYIFFFWRTFSYILSSFRYVLCQQRNSAQLPLICTRSTLLPKITRTKTIFSVL